jgi:drug/metabolite transporter (DMT)-like permease
VSTLLVLMALTSALLHAGWNAAVKSQDNVTDAMTAQMLGSVVIAAPGLIWFGLPPLASLPWIALSTVLSVFSIYALLRAYEHGDFGVVYPVARASSVLIVLPLAALVTKEWPGTIGLLGIAVVACAVAVLAIAKHAHNDQAIMPRKALIWTLAAGALIAGYIVSDAQGVRVSGSVWSYCFLLGITNTIVWCVMKRKTVSVTHVTRRYWQFGLVTAAASTASYLLILHVWSNAPVALGSALRDTSAIFAALIAVFILKERIPKLALAAVGLAAAGTVMIRFA